MHDLLRFRGRQPLLPPLLLIFLVDSVVAAPAEAADEQEVCGKDGGRDGERLVGGDEGRDGVYDGGDGSWEVGDAKRGGRERHIGCREDGRRRERRTGACQAHALFISPHVVMGAQINVYGTFNSDQVHVLRCVHSDHYPPRMAELQP